MASGDASGLTGIGTVQDAAVELIGERTKSALQQHRVRLLQLGAGVLVVAGSLFLTANLLRGYGAPNPALLVAVAGGLAALAIHRLTGRLVLSQLLVVASMVGGTLYLAAATGDFVRVLPWWGFFAVYTVVSFDGPRAVLAAGLGYSIAGATVAWLVPTDKIPNLFILAVVAPAATSAVAGFKAVARRELVDDWLEALTEVRILRGILPICMYCRRIRDDAGAWLEVEDYVARRADVSFAPELCQTCREQDGERSSDDLFRRPPTGARGRKVIEDMRRGLFVLTASLAVAVSGLLIAVNAFNRYWDPVAPLLAIMLMAAALVAAYRRGLGVDRALNWMLALLAVGISAVGLVTSDYLRIFSWWSFLIFFAVAALDGLGRITGVVIGLTAWSALLALLIPGAGIPNLLLSAVLVPSVTSMVSMYHLMSRRHVLNELMRARAEVQVLQGVLPICCRCKHLRDDDGAWQRLEAYIERRSEAMFSHGVCGDCESRFLADASRPGDA